MKAVKAYIPELDTILIASEGTGDNLLDEDIEMGYVDYVYIETQAFDGCRFPEDCDGGMMLLTVPFSERYEHIPTVLLKDAVEFMFGDVKYIELEEKQDV